jgi:hypothetical protein
MLVNGIYSMTCSYAPINIHAGNDYYIYLRLPKYAGGHIVQYIITTLIQVSKSTTLNLSNIVSLLYP